MSQDYKQLLVDAGFDLETKDLVAFSQCLLDNLPPVVSSTPIGIGTILAVMAPVGGDFLDSLEAVGAQNSNVKWALKMIEQATFDVGHPVTRAQLAEFAIAVPQFAVGVTKLLSVAESLPQVSLETLRQELYNEDWSVK